MHFREDCLAAAAGGSAGAGERGLAEPIGATVSAPHFPPATGDPAAHFSRPGPSRRKRLFAGLVTLPGPTASTWPGRALAAAPLVRPDLFRAARADRGRSGAFLRRQVLLCARIFESAVHKTCLWQLPRSTWRAAGRACALTGQCRIRLAFCGLGCFSPPAHCFAGWRITPVRTVQRYGVRVVCPHRSSRGCQLANS